MEHAEEQEQQHERARHHQLEQAQYELVQGEVASELYDLVLAEYLEQQECHLDAQAEVEEVQRDEVDPALRRQRLRVAVDEGGRQAELSQPLRLGHEVRDGDLGLVDQFLVNILAPACVGVLSVFVVWGKEQLVAQVAVRFHSQTRALAHCDHCCALAHRLGARYAAG